MFGSGFSEWALATILAVTGSFVTFLFALLRVTTTWDEHEEKERELRDKSDKRLNDRMERDSIRKNFDLQRARMPNLQTAELVAFSQAAAAEVNKRKEAEVIGEQEEQAMIDQINRSRNRGVPKAGVYGEECNEIMREMNKIAAKRQAERARIRPQWGPAEEIPPAFLEPWTQVGHALEIRRRTGAVHGGFTSRQKRFRDEARIREELRRQPNGPMVDIASEKRHGLRGDGTPFVVKLPIPVQVAESRGRVQEHQRHLCRAEVEARKRRNLAAQFETQGHLPSATAHIGGTDIGS